MKGTIRYGFCLKAFAIFLLVPICLYAQSSEEKIQPSTPSATVNFDHMNFCSKFGNSHPDLCESVPSSPAVQGENSLSGENHASAISQTWTFPDGVSSSRDSRGRYRFHEPGAQKLTPWSVTDSRLEFAYTVAHVLDWGTTLYGAKHPESWREMNPILGAHPPQNRVNIYFAATLGMHFAVSRVLPPKPRKVWQIGTILLEGYVASRNFKRGAHLGF